MLNNKTNNKTTIQLKKSTKIKLAKFGNLTSTYDSVISDLITHAKKCDLFWSKRT
ncbi:MAG: hypothetical protein HY222_00665 [Thaumarchaeota archaeon]|nr:hypothetical protein [Nitrososphaerota archaeon]MBI3640897.1 hypothetical protein [Nitrososphaerota archaeon]